ncbi:MAG: hypothetical protein ACE5O2_04775, partial [Armatimonadota bacterium]
QDLDRQLFPFATPDEIEVLVKPAICDGGKEGMFLYPTATPITSISDRYRDNAIRYIEAGLRYGSTGSRAGQNEPLRNSVRHE